ncbi:MAG: glutaredoxin family protein [Proteobacteria bacterium]|nr:glutaredoxin family protein [Pseudomonadota bacterium]
MTTLIFYTSVGCHLCEQAEVLLAELADCLEFEIESVDIGADAALVSLYGIRIPVVKNKDSGAEIGWPFTLEDLSSL